MENIMKKLQDILPDILLVEKVEINDSFSSFESWDSLTILMVTEFCAGEYGIFFISRANRKFSDNQGIERVDRI